MMGLIRACARRFRGNSGAEGPDCADNEICGTCVSHSDGCSLYAQVLREVQLSDFVDPRCWSCSSSQVQCFSKVVQTVQVPQVQVVESTVDPSTL